MVGVKDILGLYGEYKQNPCKFLVFVMLGVTIAFGYALYEESKEKDQIQTHFLEYTQKVLPVLDSLFKITTPPVISKKGTKKKK